MGANNSSGKGNHTLPNNEGKATQSQLNRNTPPDKNETNLKSCQPSKDHDDVEADNSEKIENKVSQDGAQVHEVQNNASCSLTKSLEVTHVGASNAITSIILDGEKGDIVTESEVIVSFPSNSAESKYPADQIDGAIGPVNGPVACDHISHGRSNIVPDDGKRSSDQRSNGNGAIELFHSDRSSNVSGSLGPADGRKTCDRVDQDKIGIRPANGGKNCDRVDQDKTVIKAADGRKTCDRVDQDKIGIRPADVRKTCDLADQDKTVIRRPDDGKTCDRVDQDKIGNRPADDGKTCDRVGQDKIGIRAANGGKTCDLADQGKIGIRAADGRKTCDRVDQDKIGIKVADGRKTCDRVELDKIGIRPADGGKTCDLVDQDKIGIRFPDDGKTCDRVDQDKTVIKAADGRKTCDRVDQDKISIKAADGGKTCDLVDLDKISIRPADVRKTCGLADQDKTVIRRPDDGKTCDRVDKDKIGIRPGDVRKTCDPADQDKIVIRPDDGGKTCDLVDQDKTVIKAADVRKTSDRVDLDKIGIRPADVRKTCDLADQDKTVIRRPDDGKTCDRVDRDKIGIRPADSKKKFDRVGQDKIGIRPADGGKTCDRVDQDKISIRPADGKTKCERVGQDKIGNRPADDGKTCDRVDQDKIGIRPADIRKTCDRVDQGNIGIRPADGKEKCDLVDQHKISNKAADVRKTCDRVDLEKIGIRPGDVRKTCDPADQDKIVIRPDDGRKTCDLVDQDKIGIKAADGRKTCDRIDQDKIGIRAANGGKTCDLADQDKILIRPADDGKTCDRVDQGNIGIRPADVIKTCDRVVQDKIGIRAADGRKTCDRVDQDKISIKATDGGKTCELDDLDKIGIKAADDSKICDLVFQDKVGIKAADGGKTCDLADQDKIGIKAADGRRTCDRVDQDKIGIRPADGGKSCDLVDQDKIVIRPADVRKTCDVVVQDKIGIKVADGRKTCDRVDQDKIGIRPADVVKTCDRVDQDKIAIRPDDGGKTCDRVDQDKIVIRPADVRKTCDLVVQDKIGIKAADGRKTCDLVDQDKIGIKASHGRKTCDRVELDKIVVRLDDGGKTCDLVDQDKMGIKAADGRNTCDLVVQGKIGIKAADGRKTCDPVDHDRIGIRPADGGKTCDRADEDKIGIKAAHGRKTCDRVDQDKIVIRPADVRKTCYLVDQDKIVIKAAECRKTCDLVVQDKIGIKAADGRKTCDHLDEDKIGIRPAVGGKTCDLVDQDKIGIKAADGGKTCDLVDQDKISFIPADGKKKCDRFDEDKIGTRPSDVRKTCDRVDQDKIGIRPADGGKTCDLVDQEKIGIKAADGRKTYDRVDQEKIGIKAADVRKTCDRVDLDKISFRFADVRKNCERVDPGHTSIIHADNRRTSDRVENDNSDFQPADGKITCDRVDHDKGSNRSVNGKAPFEYSFHAIESIGFTEKQICCTHVGQASSTIGYADGNDVCYYIQDDTSSPTSDGAFGYGGDCGSGGTWYTDSRDAFDGIGHGSGLIDGRYPSEHFLAFHPADAKSDEAVYASDNSFFDDDYRVDANDGGDAYDEYFNYREDYGKVTYCWNDQEEQEEEEEEEEEKEKEEEELEEEEEEDHWIEGYEDDNYSDYPGEEEEQQEEGQLEEDEEEEDYWVEGYEDDNYLNYPGEEEEQEEELEEEEGEDYWIEGYEDDNYSDYPGEEEEQQEELEEEEEEEDYWFKGYEDDNYLDYPGVLVDSTKKSQFGNTNLVRSSANNPQSPVQLPGPSFKTSKGEFNEDRNRSSRSLPNAQWSRRKTGNLDTQSCAKAALHENFLLVSGLNETTTKDGLLNFIEVLSGREVNDVTMIKQGNALVTISAQEQDIAKMKEKCKKRTLDKNTITIETAPAPTCILVSGLPPSASLELVSLYFENPRNQGGPVEKVHFTSKSGQAVVVFNNTKDMKRVLARQEEHPHVLGGRQLTVSIFHESLQDVNSDAADPSSSFPTDDKLDRKQVAQQLTQKQIQRQSRLAVDPDIMEFIYRSTHLDQLMALLKDEGGVIDWIPGSIHAVIVCSDKPNDDSCQSLCIGIVQSFLDKFVKWDVRIQDDLRNIPVARSISAVLGVQEDDPPLVKSITNDSAFYLRIVSLKYKKEFYDKILQEKLVEMYCLERSNSYRVEKITSIPEERIKLLRKINFEETLRNEFKELTVKFDAETGEICLKGPPEELICARNRCQVQEGKMTENELHLPKSVLKVLSTVEGLQAVEAEIAENQIEAAFILQETDEATPHCVAAKVLGISSDHADKASNLISSLTAEKMVTIEERDLLLTVTREWDQTCAEIVQKGKVVIQRDDTGRLWVGGFSKDVTSSVKRLNSFLKENAAEVLTEELNCRSKDARTYLRKCREGDLLAIQKRLQKFDVKILDGDDAKRFVISGHQEGLALTRRTLNTLVDGTVTKEVKLEQPGLRKFFLSGKAGNLLEKVEKDQKCLVRVEKLFPKPKTQERPTVTFAVSDSEESEDDEIISVEDTSSSLPSNSAASFSVTTQGHTISWKTGNIEQEKAHTVVSSQGACARVVKRFAGPGMLAMAPPAGEIRVSAGFKLPCQHVIHTRCSEWNGGAGEGTLRNIVRKSLRKVDELKGSSVAFPVIGTGNLQFPRNEASRIMLDEVINFCSGNPHSCVKDIRFVVFHHDQSLIAAFQQEINSLQVRLGGTIPNSSEVTWWKKVEVVQGNLTRERADAIVNIIGKEMNLYRAGELSKAVARAGGEQVIQECSRLGQQPGGSAVMTSGGNLHGVRHIIHLVPEFSDKQHLQSCLEKCLLLASTKGLRSISIPAVGTGAYHLTAADSAQLTFQALRSVRGSCSSFSRIRIVIYQQDMLGAFTQELQRVMQFQTRDSPVSTPTAAATAKPSSAKKVVRKRKKKKKPSVTLSGSESTVHIFVTGANETAVNNALGSLKTGFSEACTSQVITNECVSQLSDKQVSSLLQTSKKRDVELKLEPAKNRIEVRGDAKDVTEMIGETWRELNERLKRARAHEHAKLLSSHVKWCYVLNGKTRRFNSTKNAKIEEAFNKQCLSVTVDIQGKKFQLNLKNNTGLGSLSGEHITVSRMVLGPTEVVGISLPGHWTPMPRQRNGNEVTVHTVKLASHSSEFQSVAREFQKTAGSVAIKSVERIQNPLLYQAYQLRKQKMDKDNRGNNERQLFHGTASGNVKKINSQGFNRNFSGLAHGTALGKGVYFARDASFSMKYTPESTGGSRFVYLARVLVGRYCHGDSKLVVPPPRDPLRPEILFDSVVDDKTNPGIFVVFSDSQCYPEYLIKF